MVTSYEKQLHLPVSAKEAFDWHERSGALDRLIPPWESVSVLKRGDGIREGSVVELAQRLGPLRLKWIAKHHGYEPGQEFRDTQISGPFAAWEHLHQFQANGNGNGVLTDHIEYQVPGGFIGRLLGGQFINKKVRTMFTHRHKTTQDDLAAHAKYKDVGDVVDCSLRLVGMTKADVDVVAVATSNNREDSIVVNFIVDDVVMLFVQLKLCCLIEFQKSYETSTEEVD